MRNSGQPDYLYRNDGGTFVDVAGELGVANQDTGMGGAFVDYDGARFHFKPSNILLSVSLC